MNQYLPALSNGSKKIGKHHKSSMFTPEEESKLVEELCVFLKSTHEKGINPIRRLITSFCKDNKIKRKEEHKLVSSKKAYAILKKVS